MNSFTFANEQYRGERGLSQIQFQKNKFKLVVRKNSIKAAELSIQHENGIYIELDKHNVKLKCPQVMHSEFEYWTTKSSQPKILKAFTLYIGKGMFWICLRNLPLVPLALHESEARSTQTLHSTAPAPSSVECSIFILNPRNLFGLNLRICSPQFRHTEKASSEADKKIIGKDWMVRGSAKAALARAQALLLFLCKRGRRICVTLLYMIYVYYIYIYIIYTCRIAYSILSWIICRFC